MTVKTLFEETLSLGFEDSYEISRVFLFAARRALRTIAAEWGGTYSRTVVPRSKGGEDASEGISLAEYISDYLAPSSPPLDKDGKRIVGAQICGEVLILPKGYTGEVTVRYKRVPKELPEEEDGAIDVPRIAEHLLPLLTAAYTWLDDAPEKAEYYMQIYLDETARLKRRIPTSVGADYGDVTGWAR